MLNKNELLELIAICKSSRPGDGATPEMHEAYQQSVIRAEKIISSASTFTGSAELFSFYKQCLGDPGRHPFLLAAERGHRGIVELFMKTPPGNALYDSINDPAIWYASALCYTKAIGVEACLSVAREWYERLYSDIDNADAMFYLGRCYAKGVGVQKSLENAIPWYNKAANLGNANALYSLGIIYHHGGNGVDRNQAMAIDAFKRASGLSHAGAQSNLGIFYKKGDGVERDLVKAIELLQCAADQRYPVAEYNLGNCYERGDGVEKDLVTAAILYQRAAQWNDIPAQASLGFFYLNGLGVEKDEPKAVKWLQRAAGHGHAGAQANLGYCYLNGIVVGRDEAKAMELFQCAADQGLDSARKAIEGLKKRQEGLFGGVGSFFGDFFGSSDTTPSSLLSEGSKKRSDSPSAGKKRDGANEVGVEEGTATSISTSFSPRADPQALRRRTRGGVLEAGK